MSNTRNLIDCSSAIKALANVCEGISSSHYPVSRNEGNCASLDRRNYYSSIKDFKSEIYSINELSLYLKAENISEIQARWRLIHDLSRVCGLNSVEVARSARALSSDAYRLRRLGK